MNQTTASTEEEDVTSSSWALEDEYLPNDVALYIASMLQVTILRLVIQFHFLLMMMIQFFMEFLRQISILKGN
jgi:hypothetical protein